MEASVFACLFLIFGAVLTQSQTSLRMTWNEADISQDPGTPDSRELIYHDEINIRTTRGSGSTPDGDGVLVCRHSGNPGDVEWLRPESNISVQANNTGDFRIIRQIYSSGPTRVQLARVVETPSTAGNEGLWSCNGGGLSKLYVSLYRRGNGGLENVAVSLQSSSFEDNMFAFTAETSGGPPTTFSWKRNGSPLSNGNSYSISIMADPNDDPNDRENCLYRSTLHVTGMLPGIYQFQADNRATPGDVRATFTIEGGDPSNLQVVQTGMNMVELTWDPPPGPPSGGYRVVDSGNNIDMTTTSTSLTIEMLSLGDYSFRVTAISQHFPDGMAGPVGVTIRDALAPVISLSQLTATSVNVSWTQPMFSFTVSNYRVSVERLTPCRSITSIRGPRNQNADDMKELFEGLEEFIHYRAQVRVNFQSPSSSFTVSSVSAKLNFTTLAIGPSEVPSNTRVVTLTSRTFAVSWNAINCENQNGPNFHYYVDFQRMDGGAAPVGTVNNVMFTVEGLQPFTNYTFRVRGVNDAGNGGYTSIIMIQTNGEAPSEVPSNVIPVTTSRTISVFWDAVDSYNQNGPNFRYDVDFQRASGGVMPARTVDDTRFEVEGLQPFTFYTFRVRGVNDVGNGDYTSLIVIQTNGEVPSEVPTNVIPITTSRTISVSWEAIDSNNENGPNFRYDVDFQRMHGGAVPVGTVNNVVFTVMGLQPFTVYTFRVRGANNVGNGDYTSLIMIQTNGEDDIMTATVSVSVVVTFFLTIILNNTLLLVGYCIFRARRNKFSKNDSADNAADTRGMAMKESILHGPMTASRPPQDCIYTQPEIETESDYVVVN